MDNKIVQKHKDFFNRKITAKQYLKPTQVLNHECFNLIRGRGAICCTMEIYSLDKPLKWVWIFRYSEWVFPVTLQVSEAWSLFDYSVKYIKNQKQKQHTIQFNITKQLFYSVSALKTNPFQNSWKPASDIYNNCKW